MGLRRNYSLSVALLQCSFKTKEPDSTFQLSGIGISIIHKRGVGE